MAESWTYFGCGQGKVRCLRAAVGTFGPGKQILLGDERRTLKVIITGNLLAVHSRRSTWGSISPNSLCILLQGRSVSQGRLEEMVKKKVYAKCVTLMFMLCIVSFKVYRSQLPRDNPYYPPTQDDESDNDDVAIDFTPKKFTPPPQCVICGLSAPKTCGRCHTPHYCSRQHQMVDWNMCRHKEFCNKDMSKDEMETVERLRRGRIFAEKEIVNEPEGLGQDGKEEEAQKAHAQEQQASESK